MQITVKTIEGAVYVVEVTSETQTIQDLKKAIQEKSGVNYQEQRLIFKGKLLIDDKPLSFYGIEDGFTIHMVNKAPPKPQPETQPQPQPQTQSQPQPQTQQQQAPPPQQMPFPPFPNLFQGRAPNQIDINIDLGNIPNGQQMPPFNPFMGAPFNPFMPPMQQQQQQQQQTPGQQSTQQQQQAPPPFQGPPGMGAFFGQLQQAFGALSQMMQQQPPQPMNSDPINPQNTTQTTPQNPQNPQNTNESEPTETQVDVIIHDDDDDDDDDDNNNNNTSNTTNNSGSVSGPTITVQRIPVSETFNTISEQINGELHSNQPRSVYEVMKDVSQATGEDDDDDDDEDDDKKSGEPNSTSSKHKLKQLINTIYSSLNMRDLMEFFSMNFENAYKIHESGRKWLCDNLGDPEGSDNVSVEQLESFTDEYYADFTKLSKKEVPKEIMARVKEGVDFKGVVAEELKKHVLRILKLLMTPLSEDHSVFAGEFRMWILRFVKEFIDKVASIMIGGIDDVQVVVQYFIYSVNITKVLLYPSKKNSFLPLFL